MNNLPTSTSRAGVFRQFEESLEVDSAFDGNDALYNSWALTGPRITGTSS